MSGRIRIALLAGGWSAEREVSLKSGESVYRALDREKYSVTWYDPRDELQAFMEARQEIDLAFILLHGRYGEDGRIQGLLDILSIPFVGSGVLASAMALNKKVAKRAYVNAGLKVAKDVFVSPGEGWSAQDIMEGVGPVSVVKPLEEGSSLGVSICRTKEELGVGIEKAFRHDREVMVEQFIEGLEVTCCVLGNRELETLPLIEIAPDESYPFFNFEAKYEPGATHEICPARISEPLAEAARYSAKEAHRSLGCRVWSRTDMIIRGEDVYVLETNTIPGMTENSLVPLAARTAGLSMQALLDKLIMLSLEPI